MPQKHLQRAKHAELPKVVAFDPAAVQERIERAATAISFDVATNLKWERDDSLSSACMQLAGDVNPFLGLYNLVRHGQWRSEATGAWAVETDARRRLALRSQFVGDYQKVFNKRLQTQGPETAVAYLETLDKNAKAAWKNLCYKFEAARQVNKHASLLLNDAIDRTFRIRVGASVAFVVAGSLPAGAVTAIGATSAAPWWCVALASGVYGFLAEAIWNRSDLPKTSAAGYRLGDGARAGGTAAGATAAQKGFEKHFTRQQEQIVREANQRLARAQLSRQIHNIHSDLAGRRLHPSLVSHHGEQRLAEYWKEHATKQLEKRARFVKGAGAGLFIAVGLVMMKDDIKAALQGLTADTDRTR